MTKKRDPLEALVDAATSNDARLLAGLLGPPGTPEEDLIALMRKPHAGNLTEQETDRTTLALIVLRPEPGNNQERMNRLIDAALARGLRWSDLADYLDRDDMPEMAAMLDTYAKQHGLPLLGDGI